MAPVKSWSFIFRPVNNYIPTGNLTAWPSTYCQIRYAFLAYKQYQQFQNLSKWTSFGQYWLLGFQKLVKSSWDMRKKVIKASSRVKNIYPYMYPIYFMISAVILIKILLPASNPTGNQVPRIRHNLHVCYLCQTVKQSANPPVTFDHALEPTIRPKGL